MVNIGSAPTVHQLCDTIATLATTKSKNGKFPVSPATIWRWVKEGDFPKPFKLGKNKTVWDAGEVNAWIEEKKGAQK